MGSEADVLLIVNNLIEAAQAWWRPIFMIGYLFGFMMLGGGVIGLGVPGRNGRGYAGASVLIGIVILNMLPVLNAATYTLFEKSFDAELSFVPPEGGDPMTATFLKLGIYLIQIIGVYGSFKGWFMLRDSVTDARMRGAAIWHIVGGIAAVNVVTVTQYLGATAGGFVEDTVQLLLG